MIINELCGDMMNLYDIIPQNLFSVLVSPNKSLYVRALFVLLEAFKLKLKISKDELVSMIVSSLDEDIMAADFSDEKLLENEYYSSSGRAHFLVRKFKENGWLTIETESDFIDYVTLPGYSIKIIQLLYDLTHESEQENFAFVYSTYSSLKTAGEGSDPMEITAALQDSAYRTEQLVESLKTAYHGITSYNQKLINLINVNNVLSLHYDEFRKEIADKILTPLKIRDSVPKYKHSIEMILKRWLVDDELLDSVADCMFSAKKFDSKEKCHEDIIKKIYYILDTYNSLERDYISVIDDKNRQYTRATTQKIDYLINSDQSVKGNLVALMRYMADDNLLEKAFEMASDSFNLFEEQFISEESLYERKRGVKHKNSSLQIIENDDIELHIKSLAEAKKLMNNKYSKKNVMRFVEKILGDKFEATSADIMIENDETYVMTLLAVAYSGDRNSSYAVNIEEDFVENKGYRIPKIIFRKKGGK